jgi:hypothetical protein
MFRPGVSFGPEDFRRKRRAPAPFIVTEQRADVVDLVYRAFRPLDFDQRQRLLWRIARAPH